MGWANLFEACAMATSCKDAIQMFVNDDERNPPNKESGEKTPAEECEEVKLYFMKPPISKMDPAALSTLKACQKLSLSTNNIDKIANLGALENLRVLSLGRNNIKRLDNLDAIANHLEELWVSYNHISSLNGLEKCANLRVLYCGNNKISDMKEVAKLQTLPALEDIVLYGNPIHTKIIDDGDLAWPKAVIPLLPNMKKLDGTTVIEWKVKIAEGNEKQLKWLF